MALQVALTHRTAYTYDRLIGLGPQIIRLRPAPHNRTSILSYSLKIEPKLHFLNWQQDPFGNYLARLVFPEKTKKLEITVDLVADMATINPFDFFVEDYAQTWPFDYTPELKEELAPYLATNEPGPLLKAYIKTLNINVKTGLDFIWALNLQLQKDISYLIRMEPGVQTPEVTLKNKSGSCRDSGWLLVQLLRHHGLAARFVSGYLIQLKPDEKPLEGPEGPQSDFTDLHAWAEVYLPGAGWIGLDPTSGLFAGEGHIPLAATPSPQNAAPISGIHEEADVAFTFDMSVKRIYETPRVTFPYTDDQWQKINAAGFDVDQRLQKNDVRLSMGGEPTFVSIDNPEGEEWNTGAVGPTKRRFAEDLVRRLRRKFALGGLLHFGQGKWYPGEQLPRWAFSVYWRTDGHPLWENEDLIETEIPQRPATQEHAGLFAAALAEQLGLPQDSAIPAYEDPAYFSLIEQKLPINLDPATNNIDDPQERERVIKIFDRGLGVPLGFVMPIQVWHAQSKRRWATERWDFRRKRLYLVPGDSPVGLRLPLGSLPYVPPSRYPHIIPIDPFADRTPLPARDALAQTRDDGIVVSMAETSLPNTEVIGTIRTAMAIEPRDGHLCVFMPPLEDGEDYAALAAAIEEAAKQTNQTVRLEGYEPPRDWRFNVIKVTPDPGVIEVNIQPANNWAEAVAITETLYDEAKHCRLGTEKFMVDGRHTGTGGGNHIVLGAARPEDSPFLRRPDLLASIIAYWQNHPSLSYLFSGLFIGPTSQAPRMDEARKDQLYEMEIAISQVPDQSKGSIPNWLVDRIFRNLLIDVSGNTHRAEICIDKLYSPDSTTGRLGLVEFRSFEMPPHPQMSLAQQLLIRALVAFFWEKPYKGALIEWGTELHDRFMLPEFLWTDLNAIINELRQAGFNLEASWFAPHFEFRFPVCGQVTYEGIEIELRQALEPWHVLGEEGASGGTVRYVDSSLERLQVKVRNNPGNRYQVLCNRITLPLRAGHAINEAVAGVRFRAWQPPNCLQPTIAPHTPLTFDLFDSWNNRSVGGCRYHVAHPGGRAYDTFPVNALEAESRRLARFETYGHTAEIFQPVTPPVNRSFPFTLDLRRVPKVED